MVQIANKAGIKDITFSCDDFELKASLHLPPVGRPPVVIGCHGLLSDRNSPKQIALAGQPGSDDRRLPAGEIQATGGDNGPEGKAVGFDRPGPRRRRGIRDEG